MELNRVALFVCLLPLTAYAAVTRDKCDEVDHSRQLGSNRNQANSDWCWASSASDLIGFAQGLGPMRQVSLIDTALTGLSATGPSLMAAGESSDWDTYQAARSEAPYITESERRKRGLRLLDRQGWSLTAVISYNQQPRVCLESEVSSLPATPFKPGRWAPDPFVLPAVTREHDSRRPFFAVKERAELAFIESQLAHFGDGTVSIKKISTVHRMIFACEHQNAPLFQQQSSLFEEYNQAVLRLVAQGVRERCRAGPPVKPMRAEVMDFGRAADSKAAIQAAEWLGEGPISVSVPSQLLFAKGGASKWHEAVLAGRRWNERTGSCEFKLRDSFGTSCEHVREGIRDRCEAGNIWLSEREIQSNARFLTRVQVR